ncbi:hypothetical protein DFS34DRAFT_494878 [Phlyctochytrium arcticum]|nr:hypothetical protein DFS34DRAFT_494878 [Phlyctochytrium arcticum]
MAPLHHDGRDPLKQLAAALRAKRVDQASVYSAPSGPVTSQKQHSKYFSLSATLHRSSRTKESSKDSKATNNIHVHKRSSPNATATPSPATSPASTSPRGSITSIEFFRARQQNRIRPASATSSLSSSSPSSSSSSLATLNAQSASSSLSDVSVHAYPPPDTTNDFVGGGNGWNSQHSYPSPASSHASSSHRKPPPTNRVFRPRSISDTVKVVYTTSCPGRPTSASSAPCSRRVSFGASIVFIFDKAEAPATRAESVVSLNCGTPTTSIRCC